MKHNADRRGQLRKYDRESKASVRVEGNVEEGEGTSSEGEDGSNEPSWGGILA